MFDNLIIADLHLHSRFSRAVSQKMDVYEIARWATKKGIGLVGTADWTHPIWFKELQSNLEETELGFYKLKKLPADVDKNLRFVLTVEVSNIYTQAGSVRRIHTVIFSPSLTTCQKVQQALAARGVNLSSDGRPIMGLSIIELCELLWEIDENIFVLPAHIWTPWFSLYGSSSGFDSINDCFGKYTDKITAVETGLSSDPLMNWSIKELAGRAIVSFSDAHSGQKLGREATVFKKKNKQQNINFSDLIGALKQDNKANLDIAFTIEFFPEEGKYHFSGHRNCNVRLAPTEVKKHNGLCPQCKKKLTIGVLDRVQYLANKLLEEKDAIIKKSQSGVSLIYPPDENRPPYVSVIPLLELLAEIQDSLPQSKAVVASYNKLVTALKNEFYILLFADLNEVSSIAGARLALAIEKMRKRDVQLDPGYDGVFGKITVNVEQSKKEAQQTSLF